MTLPPKKNNAPKCPDCGGWARWEGRRCQACSVIHAKAYRQSPECKAYQKAYQQSPECKAYKKAYYLRVVKPKREAEGKVR